MSKKKGRVIGGENLFETGPPPIIGCCGWSEGKAKYFNNFEAVEVQSTFYEPPTPVLADKWRSLAPASFHFCMKAWQLITHTSASPTYRKLKAKLAEAEYELTGSFQDTEQVMLAWERTAVIARSLQARVVLFQCPASFQPEPENLRNLKRFFRTVKREPFAFAWEPRGGWPPDLVAGLCSDLQIMLCIDPLNSGAEEVPAPYWRLHGKGGYSYRYTEEDLQQLAILARRRATEVVGPQYIFFNNIWMKDDALRFKRLMGRQKVS